eukprot:5946890-Pleurochrysis_carterae.AAC.1
MHANPVRILPSSRPPSTHRCALPRRGLCSNFVLCAYKQCVCVYADACVRVHTSLALVGARACGRSGREHLGVRACTRARARDCDHTCAECRRCFFANACAHASERVLPLLRARAPKSVGCACARRDPCGGACSTGAVLCCPVDRGTEDSHAKRLYYKQCSLSAPGARAKPKESRYGEPCPHAKSPVAPGAAAVSLPWRSRRQISALLQE